MQHFGHTLPFGCWHFVQSPFEHIIHIVSIQFNTCSYETHMLYIVNATQFRIKLKKNLYERQSFVPNYHFQTIHSTIIAFVVSYAVESMTNKTNQ